MRAPRTRRANLATIVGSSLAAVAAGSLIAFSTLAEQAGLEGLATRGIQPAHPSRTDGNAEPITIPAPATAPPADPRRELVELVASSVDRPEALPATPPPAPAPSPAGIPPSPAPPAPRRVDDRARVAVARTDVPDDDSARAWHGPPYGHAYGYYGKRPEKTKPDGKDAPKGRSRARSEQPVYARRAAGEAEPKHPEAPGLKKAPRGAANGKGRSKHAASAGNGKAKGHSKHAASAGNGKGKGHSKHHGKRKRHSKQGG